MKVKFEVREDEMFIVLDAEQYPDDLLMKAFLLRAQKYGVTIRGHHKEAAGQKTYQGPYVLHLSASLT